MREEIEKANVSQCANNGENAEQAGKRLAIEIAEVFPIGRDDNSRYDSGNERDEHDGVLFQKTDRGAKLRWCFRRMPPGSKRFPTYYTTAKAKMQDLFSKKSDSNEPLYFNFVF